MSKLSCLHDKTLEFETLINMRDRRFLISFRGYRKRKLWLGTEGAEDDIKSDFTEYH